MQINPKINRLLTQPKTARTILFLKIRFEKLTFLTLPQ